MTDSFSPDEVVVTTPETEDTATSESADNGAPGDAEPTPPKTFTQEEVDRIIGAEKAKAERKARREMQQAAEAAQRQTPSTPPNAADFQTVEAFVKASAIHEAERIVQEREFQKQQAEIEDSYAERADAARAKYSDFKTVTENENLPISQVVAEAILSSTMGPDVYYHLGKNPDEAERISRLSPIAQVREIGKIEASLSANPPVRKSSSAPEPITPLGSRASTPNYTASDPRSVKMSMDDWAASRTKEIIKRRQS